MDVEIAGLIAGALGATLWFERRVT